MTARAAVAGRAEQIAQRSVAEEIERLVGDFELDLAGLAVATAAHRAACLFRFQIWRRRNVAGLLHPLDDLLDQFFELVARLLLVALGGLAEHFLEVFKTFYGPMHKAFAALDPEKQKDLENDLVSLIGRLNRATDGAMVVPSEYLEVVIIKR